MGSAFGRMPIVIHLGDFLQKKPIGGHSISLIDDLKERERSNKLPEDFPAEFQQAMKVFCQTPIERLCFEFQASNRIKEPKLCALMDFLFESGGHFVRIIIVFAPWPISWGLRG